MKLFRKIRQRLLVQNRFTRYLIYAVGEIVLVVIGILNAMRFPQPLKERALTQISKEM